jgi:dihydroorotase
MNRNAIFAGGVRPHHYCLPVLKREVHRQALMEAVTSGNPRFFLGTDSAPHAQRARRKRPAAAPAATRRMPASSCTPKLSTQAGALDRLEAFASFNGPDWYGTAAQ